MAIVNEEQAIRQDIIFKVCEKIKETLYEKNIRCWDSVINPKRIFSKASIIEQINVRLDDKLSRMVNRNNDEDEDIDMDIIEDLILKRVVIIEGKT